MTHNLLLDSHLPLSTYPIRLFDPYSIEEKRKREEENKKLNYSFGSIFC